MAQTAPPGDAYANPLVKGLGEIGRAPISPRMAGGDRKPHGFSVWRTGGGVKGGTIVGATDEYGLEAVEKPKKVNDLHATSLHLMGFGHTRLTYLHNGRYKRLTDVEGEVPQAAIRRGGA